MDPYEILGIAKNATQEEIKKAYRREAMKWHPDRCNNSSEARERFHQAADAYKFLSENYSRGGYGDFGTQSSGGYQYQHSKSDQSENSSYSQYSRGDSEDKFADTVFWEVMLDYAIKLAQNGLHENAISIDLSQHGCPDRLAAIIADKAFNIHAHYASNPGKNNKPGRDKSTFKEERLEADLQKAFIGQRNILWSPKDTVGYYQVVFSEFKQTANSNPLFKINTNNRLIRILNFSILLFAVIVVAIDIFPGETEYKLLPDLTMLQLPLGILSLMFVWTIYRKLWVITLVFWLIYLVTLVFFNTFIPQALNNNLTSILPIAIICYTPFIFIALFANYFYYRKAQKTIGSANLLFENHQDKIIWIKNRAGTSNTAAFLFIFIFFSSLIYLVTNHGGFLNSINFNLLNIDNVEDDSATQKIKLRSLDAGRFFEIAESHFNSSPPDYLKASMAYSIAADNGSLLAAYKLGYMHYVGEGVKQSDLLALEYFELASRAPLAFQPHSLKLITEYLAESYNNLGIMYQSGYGTNKNIKVALDMYSKGVEFGSKNAKFNLGAIYTQGTNIERKRLANPTYN
jgi:curved DNA-binding protein CbpA